MPRDRVLSQRELNRALLARQLLLRRERLSVPRAIERIGALQAQNPPSPYLALWSRLDGFTREHLLRAVERRQVVKATLMRVTLHQVSARDYLAYGGVVRDARLAEMRKRADRTGVAEDVARLAERVAAYAAERPRSRPELLDYLSLGKLRPGDLRPWIVWYLIVSECELVHSPESSVWRRSTAGGKYVPAPAWLGGSGANGAGAAANLVARYLGAFGPASRADLAQWTGLALKTLDEGIARLRLRRFRDERGRDLLDVPRAPLPDADTEAPVRFLPMWDSVLLAHDDRSRVLPDEYRRVVIRKNGDVQQTFLVDGFVAGMWRLVDGRVELEAFEPIPARVRRELEREAKALTAFHR